PVGGDQGHAQACHGDLSMAVEGIGSSLHLAGIQHTTTRGAGASGATTHASEQHHARQVQPDTATPVLTPAGSALPVEPPPGTDPELWAVLTSEERAYFARVQSLGPLTYSRGERAPALPRGGRIDVQVRDGRTGAGRECGRAAAAAGAAAAGQRLHPDR